MEKDQLPEPEELFVEDIPTKIQAIEKMPLIETRGFSFPYDSDGYYLVWPDKSYYLKRRFDGNSSNKYRGPSGHHRPLLRCGPTSPDLSLCFVVEGEINCLSLSKAFPEIAVCSPGSAGNFYSRTYRSSLDYYGRFDRVVIVADLDKAGAIAAIELKSLMPNKDVSIVLMPEDCNDLMVNKGVEYLRKEIEKRVVLPKRMQAD